MKKRAIFIGATGQNVGKTTVCLGALAGLQKYYKRVGFCKPVGQQYQVVDDGQKVDKDAVLFKEYFDFSLPYTSLSPIICHSRFTREYLNGEHQTSKLLEQITLSYRQVAHQSEFTIVEGTGHLGVGSIFNLNNVQIAKALNLNIVLVAKGGIGSTFDEIALNHALCQLHAVKVAGVILNKVQQNKAEQIVDYLTRALRPLSIPLLGTLPFDELLSTPSMKDFESLFKTPLLSGESHRYCHFKHTRLAASAVPHFLHHTAPDQLIVTPASREDLIEALIAHKSTKEPQQGLILTSQHTPSRSLIEKLKSADIPSLFIPLSTFDVMQTISAYTAKIRRGDHEKVQKAISLITDHLPIERLIQAAD
jgi:phosphate acetyltransferase